MPSALEFADPSWLQEEEISMEQTNRVNEQEVLTVSSDKY